MKTLKLLYCFISSNIFFIFYTVVGAYKLTKNHEQAVTESKIVDIKVLSETDRPTDATNKPTDVTSKPAEVTSKPAEIVTKPASTTPAPQSTVAVKVTDPATTTMAKTSRTRPTAAVKTAEPIPVPAALVKEIPSRLKLVNSRAPPREKLSRRNDEEIMMVDNDYHSGVAIPLSMAEYERDIMGVTEKIDFKLQKSSSTTTKNGISTWILLSGSDATNTPDIQGPEYQIETEIITTKKPNKPKPATKKAVPKPATSIPVSKLVTRVKTAVAIENNKRKVETTSTTTTKKPKRPATVRAKKVPKTRTTTTTTEMPTIVAELSADPELLEGEVHREEEFTTRPYELTTFLIMEPKDADFDLPQDRSPGLTTKKPKNTSKTPNGNKKKKKKDNNAKLKIIPENVKNGTKTAVANIKNKDKPMTTKIYNYLAREIMPTVGVGLVGLVVTAGLATYFLGPFAPLRRSYDISDRKDDGFYGNSEDYNGQNEEEMFGKVIAGMPTAQLHRNNIRYQPYRRQAFAAPAPPPPKKPKAYPKFNDFLRYRTIEQRNDGPTFNNHAAAKSPVEPAESANQVYNHAYDPSSYSGNSDTYAANSATENVLVQQQQQPQVVNPEVQQDSDVPQAQALVQEQRPYYNYHAYQYPQQYQSKQLTENSNIVSEQTKVSEYNVAPQEQHSQFVVGSVLSGIVDGDASSVVPEHGPRRKRATEMKPEAKNLLDNEIDDMPMPYEMQNGIMHIKVTSTTEDDTVEVLSTTELPSTTVVTRTELFDNIIPAENEIKKPLLLSKDTMILPPQINYYDPTISTDATPAPQSNNFFEFLRRMMELKLRIGLGFLQSATINLQRYLGGVEKRIEDSPYFSSNPTVRKDVFG